MNPLVTAFVLAFSTLEVVRPTLSVAVDLSDDADAERSLQDGVVVPEPPVNVGIVSCGPTTAEISWEYDDSGAGSAPLQEFVLEYQTNHEPSLWHEAKTAPADERSLLFDMSPWTTYTFRMRARNNVGLSEPSEETRFTCRTPKRLPTRNPTHVWADRVQPDALVIHWEPMPPIEHNAEEFHYVVMWRKVGDNTVNSQTIWNWQHSVYIANVDGDEPEASYLVSVKASNIFGEAREPPQEVLAVSDFMSTTTTSSSAV